jgi:hypothetical protein
VPASKELNIDISISTTATVQVEVYDLLGLKVISQDYKMMNAGSHNLNLDLSQLRAGHYVVKLKENEVITDIKKFIKID